MKLFDALMITKNDVVTLVGGGGKTSTMFALASEAKERGLKTVLTTTTKIYCPSGSELPLIVNRDSQELLSMVSSKLAAFPVIIAGAELNPMDKLIGLDPSLIPRLTAAGADLVVVEADGAARKPFKAPADHEPVIPNTSTIVIPVVGIDCLDQPLDAEYIHRPEIVAELGKISMGQKVTPEVIAKVLTHSLGFRKELPGSCRWIPLINKVETAQDLAHARRIAGLIGELIPCQVVIGAAIRPNPVLESLFFN